jgi:arginyl-tRNA--protein-N-Asp/Glu arginylyltransferase
MSQFNLQTHNLIDLNYDQGLLPQRNKKDLFYQDTSCRSNLASFNLSSENRRILNNTQNFTFKVLDLKQFNFDLSVQKLCYSWIKSLGWHFPISSLKTIFTNHIFNTIYVWQDENNKIVAYSICYFSESISHIAYVFYDPNSNYKNLPIRLVLQAIIDSHNKGLTYCYLGRFSPPTTGYYKRTMPGFEYFAKGKWITYN